MEIRQNEGNFFRYKFTKQEGFFCRALETTKILMQEYNDKFKMTDTKFNNLFI